MKFTSDRNIMNECAENVKKYNIRVSVVQSERCGAEPQVGPCRAAFQSWYYNRKTGSCQSFIYGGCRGNKNNYISKEACMAACTGK